MTDHVRTQIQALRDRWRANADMLAEGNKGEWADPAVGMQRACADQLDALLATLTEPAPAGWREYVQHKPECEKGKGRERYTTGEWQDYSCTCGLDTLLTSLKEPR